MKKRILWWSDSPTTATGFAQVAKNLLKLLPAEEYDIHILGINYYGDPYDHEMYPYSIYPAMSAGASDAEMRNDPYGRAKLLHMLQTGYFDVLFIIQDTFIVETVLPKVLKLREEGGIKFSIMHYFPFDGTPKKSWVTDVVAKVDIPVAYTQYAKDLCLQHEPNLKNMPFVWHGVDTKTFCPVDATEFRKQYFKDNADKFMVLNVNRNQPRKDLFRTMLAFKELKDLMKHETKKPFLFLLCQMNDIGGNLKDMGDSIGLEFMKDWGCPDPRQYNANQGYPIEVVNLIYNACDVVFSTTVGEGFGLSLIEAMACKKVTCFPNNTVIPEITANGKRGIMYESGKVPNLLTHYGPHDNDIIRPLADIDDAAHALYYIYKCIYQEETHEVVDVVQEAYKTLKTWDDMKDVWLELFARAMKLADALKNKNIKPNEPCPCGNGQKWKQCHGS